MRRSPGHGGRERMQKTQSESTGDTTQRLSTFRREREAAKHTLSLWALSFGIALTMAGTVLCNAVSFLEERASFCWLCGCPVMGAGILIVSTCPLAGLDVEHILTVSHPLAARDLSGSPWQVQISRSPELQIPTSRDLYGRAHTRCSTSSTSS